MNDEFFLVYVEPIGKNLMDYYEYEFIFSETPDIVWGQSWEQMCPSVCGDLRPDRSTYSLVKRLKTNIPLKSAQQNSCFSMQDAIDGVIALSWEDISDYDEYPENGRLIFYFGETYMDVENKLASRHQMFNE